MAREIGKRHLGLSYSRGRDLESLPPAEAFFEKEIVTACAEVFALRGGKGTVGTAIPIDGDKFNREDLESLLAKRARRILDFVGVELQQDGKSATTKRILVYIGEDYDTKLRLVVTTGALISQADQNYPILSRLYCFNVSDFLFLGNGGDDDRDAWQVRAAVQSEHGKESPEYKDVNRIIQICRRVLFDNLRNDEVMRLMPELTELRIKFGRAAMAIITDFIDEFRDRMDAEADEEFSFDGTTVSRQDIIGRLLHTRFVLKNLAKLL